jgi:hypothetical protein
VNENRGNLAFWMISVYMEYGGIDHLANVRTVQGRACAGSRGRVADALPTVLETGFRRNFLAHLLLGTQDMSEREGQRSQGGCSLDHYVDTSPTREMRKIA